MSSEAGAKAISGVPSVSSVLHTLLLLDVNEVWDPGSLLCSIL